MQKYCTDDGDDPSSATTSCLFPEDDHDDEDNVGGDDQPIENIEYRLRLGAEEPPFPVPQCHNIVSTSQILTSQSSINLQRLADLYPFTTYDRKRFAAITIRLANPHCTCLLFGSGKLVITGSTSFRFGLPSFCRPSVR